MANGRIDEKPDPRVTRTRRLIEEAFLAVLKERGFEGLSVQDVTERAGINRVTFYSHFDDKYSLLRAWIRSSLSAEIERRGLCRRSLERDSVRELIRALCEYLANLHDHCKPPYEQLDWLLERQIKELSTEVLEEWLNAENGDPDQNHALAAVAAGSAIYGLVQVWITDAKRQPVDRFIETVLPLVVPILAL